MNELKLKKIKMKLYILSTIFFCAGFTSTAQKIPTAENILLAACAEANKENKNVFVIFHASWCGWCKKMDASMDDATTKKYFEDNYVTVHMTVLETPENKKMENPGATEYLRKLKGETASLPFFVILNKNGDVLEDSVLNGENIGCPASEDEVAAFVIKLKKTSKINKEGLQVIAARFKQNNMH